MTKEQIARLQELEALATAAPKGAGSKAQAEAALALLAKGPVTTTQLKTINDKYPSDPIFYARKMGAVIDTQRAKGGNTTFTLRMSVAQAQELAALRAAAAAPKQEEVKK